MAAKLFFRKALRTQKRPPRVITLDGYAASHRAVRELSDENEAWDNTKLRLSKYLNNIIEQDHRAIKSGSVPCSASRSFDEQKSPSPASNSSTAFAKINTISVNYKFRPNPRPQYGMPYSPHEKQAKHNPASAKTKFAPEPTDNPPSTQNGDCAGPASGRSTDFYRKARNLKSRCR
jgi:hypothetical protein